MRLHELLEDSRPEDNFTADDIKAMERMRDLGQMKIYAKKLITTPSKKRLRPEKVAWFNKVIDSKKSPIDLIKMMYDLLLSGEGSSVIGSRHSMDPNSYRKTFGEEEQLDEKKKKPKPTSPEKWAKAKAKARSKFEVYPSAYANAWAAKEYKRMGGGWRMGE
jgi:hypothetical protein